jgi:hypothetical protein
VERGDSGVSIPSALAGTGWRPLRHQTGHENYPATSKYQFSRNTTQTRAANAKYQAQEAVQWLSWRVMQMRRADPHVIRVTAASGRRLLSWDRKGFAAGRIYERRKEHCAAKQGRCR